MGPAEKFAQQCSAVRTASPVSTDNVLHYYHAELVDRAEKARLYTLSPAVTDTAVHDEFERVAAQWHNPSTHPNIVTVYERGTDPRPWIAVDLVDRTRLEAARDELTVPQVRALLADVAEALRNAALYNTTHGALSPETIWIHADVGGRAGGGQSLVSELTGTTIPISKTD